MAYSTLTVTYGTILVRVPVPVQEVEKKNSTVPVRTIPARNDDNLQWASTSAISYRKMNYCTVMGEYL